MELRSKSRRLHQESGLDLLIVDYLQLIDVGRSENRAVALGEVSRSLKALARDLDIPVVACSQLSRAVEQRPNHRPLLSDLRESGSIEQDADVVAFIHREDQYTTREEWERKFTNRPVSREHRGDHCLQAPERPGWNSTAVLPQRPCTIRAAVRNKPCACHRIRTDVRMHH